MLSLNQVKLNKVKIMSKNIKDKGVKGWSVSIGLYPGILFGMRSYHEEDFTTHVFYLPFIDLAIEIDK